MLPKKRLVELLVTFFLSFLMLKKKGIISTCFKFSADLPRKSWEITFSACRFGNRSLNACLRYIFHFLRKKFEPRFDLMKKDAKIAHFLYGAPLVTNDNGEQERSRKAQNRWQNGMAKNNGNKTVW